MKMFDRLPYGSSIRDKLEAYSMPVTECGCWLWLGAERRGYGAINIKNKVLYSHRVSYEEFVGPIPDGLQVMHTCDTPPCINPAHLKLGTDLDNTLDMMQKGRHFTTLTEEKVLLICSLLRQGQHQQEIADQFNISQPLVSYIKIGQSWGWLTGASRDQPIT